MARTSASVRVRETVIFAMLGTLMFVSKLVMELLPNMHLLGTLTVVYTLVFRRKALIPIYVFVLLTGLYGGFAMWWVPYIYIWTVLWGITMLLPRNMPPSVAVIVYPLVASLHGFLFGTLYAPLQAWMFGLDFNGMIAWIISGLPFDAIHGVSNFALGFLVLPLTRILRRLAGRDYQSGDKGAEDNNGREDLQSSED